MIKYIFTPFIFEILLVRKQSELDDTTHGTLEKIVNISVVHIFPKKNRVQNGQGELETILDRLVLIENQKVPY